MWNVIGCITAQHDLRFVVLAAALCLFACWTASSLLTRSGLSTDRTRAVWIMGAGFVFGSGIWATHFIAMLAYVPGLPIGYDLSLTSISVIIAIVLSCGGFAIAGLTGRMALGFAIAGAAISAMHYTGMTAITGPFHEVWNPNYVAVSILLGIGLAALSGQAAARFPNAAGRFVSVLLLGTGICTMHFTGMTAVTLHPDPTVANAGTLLDPGSLGIAVAAVAVLIVVLGLVCALVHSHLADRAALEAERLRAYVAELESTKANLERTTVDLQLALDAAAMASEAKSQFLATMSHELRTPLNAVIGFSNILADEIFGPLGDKRYAGYVEDIRTSGSHLLNLINDILDISRLDVAHTLDERELDVSTIVRQAIRMMRGQAESAHLSLDEQISADLPNVFADERRVRQVLINLLSNAIKFTPPDGQVTVSAFRLGAELAICVRDTGIGIAEEHMERAFEYFQQVDNALSRKYEGIGLGLPIAKKLIEAHGGQIRLDSLPNAGTSVTITFPATRIVERRLCAA